jgi:hypothetical protein
MKKIIAPLGSPAFQINSPEVMSVVKGLLLAVGGAVATEITKQLTGADFTIHWNAFNVGPFYFAAGAYNATMLVWAGWSALLNFVRKFLFDNSQKPA